MQCSENAVGITGELEKSESIIRQKNRRKEENFFCGAGGRRIYNEFNDHESQMNGLKLIP